MKYHNLYLHFEDSQETYNAVTEILGVQPEKNTLSKFQTNLYDTWCYQVVENDDDPPFDFINVFLDLVEPNFGRLAALGIAKEDILIWLVYEYEKQCAMEFHPEEMKRLGESGIGINIDCFEIRKKKTTKAERNPHAQQDL